MYTLGLEGHQLARAPDPWCTGFSWKCWLDHNPEVIVIHQCHGNYQIAISIVPINKKRAKDGWIKPVLEHEYGDPKKHMPKRACKQCRPIPHSPASVAHSLGSLLRSQHE